MNVVLLEDGGVEVAPTTADATHFRHTDRRRGDDTTMPAASSTPDAYVISAVCTASA